MRKQTINFRDFMAGDCGNYRRKQRPLTAYSFGITWAGFFDMTPEIAGAYFLVSAVGIAAIASNVLETHFIGRGADQVAALINRAATLLLPAVFFTFMLAFLWRLAG
jgi:hypothetical protein